MSYNLRTSLQWLQGHGLEEDAECWILSGDTVEPIIGVTSQEDGNVILSSRPIYEEPSPIPLTYGVVSDRLLESYSGGGCLLWGTDTDQTYRGSYVVNPETAVFFLFLPSDIQIYETYSEQMDQRKQQARQLTSEIERAQKPDG